MKVFDATIGTVIWREVPDGHIQTEAIGVIICAPKELWSGTKVTMYAFVAFPEQNMWVDLKQLHRTTLVNGVFHKAEDL